MKTIDLFKLSVCAMTLTFATFGSTETKRIDTSNDDMLLACIVLPWCSGPDLSSPILEPKDNKTETQDAKDEKLA